MPSGSSGNRRIESARPASAFRFSAGSTRIGTGRTRMLREVRRRRAICTAPSMPCSLNVKQSTRTSGRWLVQMSATSLCPVRLSISV